MSMTLTLLLVVQVLSALAIIVLVLLQQGKGADMGSSFGSGSAGSLFGASGAANFLSRTTKWAAIIFFASTIGLAYVSHHPASREPEGGIMQGFQPTVPSTPPASGSAVPSVPAPAQTDPSVPAAPATPEAPKQ